MKIYYPDDSKCCICMEETTCKTICNHSICLKCYGSLIEKSTKLTVDDLSSGEKQKVRFARALVQQPKYMILDEPTSNLDLSNKILIIKVMKEITDFGTKILLTSHDLNFIKESTDEKLFSSIILLSLTFSPLSEKLTISSFSKLLARLVSIFISSNEIVFFI